MGSFVRAWKIRILRENGVQCHVWKRTGEMTMKIDGILQWAVVGRHRGFQGHERGLR